MAANSRRDDRRKLFMVLVLIPLFTGLLGILFGYGNEAIWESMVGVFEVALEMN